jgi:hypothetical protein
MSIIQNIRERGAWIIFSIIAIALIAFILQDGIGRKTGATDVSTLGKVNNEVINKIDFEETYCYAKDSKEEMEEETNEPYMKVDELTLDEKINLFKELFYELSNIRLEDEELERMLTTVNYVEEEEEEVAEDETKDKPEEEVPQNPEKNTTEKVIEQLRKVEEDTKVRNMARAETYYSDT